MAHDGSEARTKPRVAMLVFNTCDSDARVLREAKTLSGNGYDVRIFALANNRHPPGVFPHPDGFTVERTAVSSALVGLLRAAHAVYHVLRGTPALQRRAVRRAAIRRAAIRTRADPSAAPVTDPRAGDAGAPARTSWRRRAARGARLGCARGGRRWRRGLRRGYLHLARPAIRALAFKIHRPSQIASFWRRTVPVVVAWGPDVVHAHDANTLPAAWRVGRRTGARLVYDSHELWRHRNRLGERRPVGRMADVALESWFVRRADAVITVSPGLVDWLRRRYRLGERVRLVRNIPSSVRTSPAHSLRAMAGLPSSAKVLLYTGRITRDRGLEEAIDGLAHLGEHVYLVMLGYGPREYIAELGARGADRSVLHRLRVVGPVPHEQVTAAAAEADVALVAVRPNCLSYRHCLPNKVFEAVQAHLPVLAYSELPDLSRLVTEYRIGRTFTSPESLALAVYHLLAETGAYQRSLRIAAEELCWENEQGTLLNLYADLAPTPAPVPVG